MSSSKERGAQPEPRHAPSEAIKVVVRPIGLGEAVRLRLEVFPLAEDLLRYEEDHYESVIHLGAFVQKELVGVNTMFHKDIGDIKADENPAEHLPIPEGSVQWQFRGLVTASNIQKKGVGRELLNGCTRYIEERGGGLLWCKAWTRAQPFYVKQGFGFTGDSFHKGDGTGEHRYMFKYV